MTSPHTRLMPLCPGAGNPIAGASPRSRARRLGGVRAVRAGRAGRRADVRRARVRDGGRRRRVSGRRRVPRQRRAPAPLRSVPRPAPTGGSRCRSRARTSASTDASAGATPTATGSAIGELDVATSRVRRDRGEPGLLRGRADPVALGARAGADRPIRNSARGRRTRRRRHLPRHNAAGGAQDAATTAAAAVPAPPPDASSVSGLGPALGPRWRLGRAAADRPRPYVRRWPRRAFFARACADAALPTTQHQADGTAFSLDRFAGGGRGMRSRQRARRAASTGDRRPCSARAARRRHSGVARSACSRRWARASPPPGLRRPLFRGGARRRPGHAVALDGHARSDGRLDDAPRRAASSASISGAARFSAKTDKTRPPGQSRMGCREPPASPPIAGSATDRRRGLSGRVPEGAGLRLSDAAAARHVAFRGRGSGPGGVPRAASMLERVRSGAPAAAVPVRHRLPDRVGVRAQAPP